MSAPDPAPPAPGWPLERKLPLLITALLAAVVGAFGAAAYQEARRGAVERASGRLASLADQLATSSATTSAQRAALLRALAADPALTAALADPGRTAAARARLIAARTPADSTVDAWELWTADGRLRLRVGAASPDSPALAAARAAAVRSDSVQRTPFLGGGAGTPAGTWTVVPARVGGRMVGVLTERRHLARSPQTARMIRQLTGEDVTVWLTSRDVDRSATQGWVRVDGTTAPAPFALPRGTSRVTVLPDARGERHFVTRAAVAQTPWLVVLAEPEAGVLRRPAEFLRTLLAVGALVLAGGAVAAWRLGRHVARPLRAVTDAAGAVAGGDYGQRVAVAGGAEVTQLAAAFNAMAGRVGEAHDALAERNAALQQANAAKARFLAVMSHELRTPLNAIGGYTELMELGLRGPVTPEQREDLARIRRSKDHLLAIITDILGFAKADAGQLELALGRVPLGDVVADAEATLTHQFAAKGVRLVAAPAPSDAAAHADRDKLQQVLLNLLTNALRFTPPGGRVDVLADVWEGRARLRVRDTGIGIAADRLAGIFEPFVQVDGDLTRRVGGTGLGLTIVRTLVDAMAGEVAVESAVGAGSTFTVTLPLPRPRAPEGAPDGAPAGGARERAVR